MKSLYKNHPQSKTQSSVDDVIAELSAGLQQHIDRASLPVLEAVYADPMNLVPVARQSGITDRSFRDDHQVLWLAADIGGHLCRPQLFHFARRALQVSGLWNRHERASSYGTTLWSDEKLDCLFDSMPPSPAFVRHAAEKLAALLVTRDALIRGLAETEALLGDPRPATAPMPIRQFINVGAA